MGDTLASPQIALGIPFGDSNFQTVDAAGLPCPPWEIGSIMSGKIYGAHIASSVMRAAADEPYFYANPYGCGRGIYTYCPTNADGLPPSLGGAGSGNAVIRTPPSLYGYVPRLGIGHGPYFSLLLITWLDLDTDDVIYFALEQYNSAGTLVRDDLLGSITYIDYYNPSDDWISYVTSAVQIATEATTRYFKIAIYFDGSSTNLGWIALDFLGLGWQEKATSVWQTWTDHYVGRNMMAQVESGIDVQRTPQGGIYTSNLRVPIIRRNLLTFEFLRASLAWRNDLRYYWQAQNGAPSTEDPIWYGHGKGLSGKMWPLLLRPRRPGIKQAMYCRMMDDPEAIGIDNALGYVEDPATFSGVLRLEELIF